MTSGGNLFRFPVENEAEEEHGEKDPCPGGGGHESEPSEPTACSNQGATAETLPVVALRIHSSQRTEANDSGERAGLSAYEHRPVAAGGGNDDEDNVGNACSQGRHQQR